MNGPTRNMSRRAVAIAATAAVWACMAAAKPAPPATRPSGHTPAQPVAAPATEPPPSSPTTAPAAAWADDGLRELAARITAPWVRVPAAAVPPAAAGARAEDRAPAIVTRPQLPPGDFRKKSYIPLRKSKTRTPERPTMSFDLPPLYVEAVPTVPVRPRMAEAPRPAPPAAPLPPVRVPYVYSRTYQAPGSTAAPVVTPPVLNEHGTTALPLLKPIPRGNSVEHGLEEPGRDEIPEPAFADDDPPERDERLPHRPGANNR